MGKISAGDEPYDMVENVEEDEEDLSRAGSSFSPFMWAYLSTGTLTILVTNLLQRVKEGKEAEAGRKAAGAGTGATLVTSRSHGEQDR